jgi:homoserine kinase
MEFTFENSHSVVNFKVKVSASTSNLGAGFDTFGLALTLFNIFEISYPYDKYSVEILYEGSKDLPTNEENLFIKTYRRTFEIFGEKDIPIKLVQYNHVPAGRGLGSSATAIIGGIKAALKILGKELSEEEILKIALEFENHPDNIVPALLGGFTISVLEKDKVYFEKIPFPEELKIVVIIPSYKVITEEARKVLPKNIPFKDAVFNIQRATLFIASLLNRDFDKLRIAVEDKLHQPYREKLIKGFSLVKKVAYENSALGVFISGSGPTIAILTEKEKSEKIAQACSSALESLNVKNKALVLEANNKGVEIL